MFQRSSKTAPPIEPLSYETCYPHLVSQVDNIYGENEISFGDTCYGTNNQSPQTIERVVFLGDSVTVGTFPTEAQDFYRTRLAEKLVETYGLTPPEPDWLEVDYGEGLTKIQESGSFASCAKLGARMDDLMEDNTQVESCLPIDQRDKSTMVVMTMGGNDLHSLTEGFIEGKSHEELWAQTENVITDLHTAIEWMKSSDRFPNGLVLYFSNLYEYTDGTGDTTSCDLAGLTGLDEPITDPALEEMTLWATREYLEAANAYGADMIFLLENFCGHGFHYDDPESRCYLGPDAELWFDNTCLHPNPTGHQVISEMFYSVMTNQDR